MNLQEMTALVRTNDRICYLCAIMFVQTINYDEVRIDSNMGADALAGYLGSKKREFNQIVMEEAVRLMTSGPAGKIAGIQE